MTPHLIEIVLLMLAFFLLGCLFGYYVRRWTMGAETAAQPAPNVTPSTRSEEEASNVEKNAPTATAAKTAEKDSVAEVAKKAPTPKTTAKKPAAKPAAAKPATKKPAAKAPAKKTAARKPAAKTAAKAVNDKPELLTAPRDGKKDDLKKIKGVGPKIESTLNEKGIYHYEQVAAWKRKDVKWFDEELSFKGRIDREEWVKQAKALAKENG
ncbi:hypothetical protein [Maritalea sp. S77]|uniref:hypothetical protein n=1 Tax=Maritalea sp. S77 TaxID=3415125 RepID=UPI003C7A6884